MENSKIIRIKRAKGEECHSNFLTENVQQIKIFTSTIAFSTIKPVGLPSKYEFIYFIKFKAMTESSKLVNAANSNQMTQTEMLTKTVASSW